MDFSRLLLILKEIFLILKKKITKFFRIICKNFIINFLMYDEILLDFIKLSIHFNNLWIIPQSGFQNSISKFKIFEFTVLEMNFRAQTFLFACECFFTFVSILYHWQILKQCYIMLSILLSNSIFISLENFLILHQTACLSTVFFAEYF